MTSVSKTRYRTTTTQQSSIITFRAFWILSPIASSCLVLRNRLIGVFWKGTFSTWLIGTGRLIREIISPGIWSGQKRDTLPRRRTFPRTPGSTMSLNSVVMKIKSPILVPSANKIPSKTSKPPATALSVNMSQAQDVLAPKKGVLYWTNTEESRAVSVARASKSLRSTKIITSSWILRN